MRRVVWVAALVVLALSLGAWRADKSYGAERFDVAAVVEESGALHVQESVVLNFHGGPFTFVFRELPTTYTDGIVDIVASVDGRLLPQGNGPGQVEIQRGNPMRVTWHMEPTYNSTRLFELSYSMLGVVRQEHNADLLWWRPLPVAHEYAIGDSRVVVTYPAEWPLGAQPAVVEGQATITNGPGQVVFEAGSLQPNEALLISLPFQSGAVLDSPPAWQVQQQEVARQHAIQKSQQDSRAWVWAGLGGLVLIGSAVLAYRALAPYRRPEDKRSGLAYEPPGDLPPAMAGSLRSDSAGVTWDQALGTLFDLAGRGYLAIEQLPKRRWTGHDFSIERRSGADWRWPHEASLIDLLLKDKGGRGQDSVKLSKLSNVISSKRWKAYSEQVQDDLLEAGLLDAARKKARERTMALALLPLALVVALAAILIIFFNSFGWWPLILAGALLIAAIMWLAGGSSISALSDEGARAAAEWEPFYRYLQRVSKGKAAPAGEDEFERYLPYAAAYGLLQAWAKGFEKRGWTETPAYFRPLQGAGQPAMSAFVAMAAATSSSGGSASTGAASAAGAAGAAGGGASGAG